LEQETLEFIIEYFYFQSFLRRWVVYGAASDVFPHLKSSDYVKQIIMSADVAALPGILPASRISPPCQ